VHTRLHSLPLSFFLFPFLFFFSFLTFLSLFGSLQLSRAQATSTLTLSVLERSTLCTACSVENPTLFQPERPMGVRLSSRSSMLASFFFVTRHPANLKISFPFPRAVSRPPRDLRPILARRGDSPRGKRPALTLRLGSSWLPGFFYLRFVGVPLARAGSFNLEFVGALSRIAAALSRVHSQSNSDIHEIFIQRFHAKFLAESLSLYLAFPSFSHRCYFSENTKARMTPKGRRLFERVRPIQFLPRRKRNLSRSRYAAMFSIPRSLLAFPSSSSRIPVSLLRCREEPRMRETSSERSRRRRACI
jgi:hypothetical protein